LVHRGAIDFDGARLPRIGRKLDAESRAGKLCAAEFDATAIAHDRHAQILHRPFPNDEEPIGLVRETYRGVEMAGLDEGSRTRNSERLADVCDRKRSQKNG